MRLRRDHCHAATGVDANAIAAVRACVRRRLLRVFVRRGRLPADDAQAMAQWQHGAGFSVDASVRIEAADRAGRERPLYESTNPGPGAGTARCCRRRWNCYFGVLTQTAAHGKFPRRHRLAGVGRERATGQD